MTLEEAIIHREAQAKVRTLKTGTAFTIAVDTFIDENEIELCENESLPTVINPRNPVRCSIAYKDGIWYCEADYILQENPEEYLKMRRAYSAEIIALLWEYLGYEPRIGSGNYEDGHKNE